MGSHTPQVTYLGRGGGGGLGAVDGQEEAVDLDDEGLSRGGK